MLIEPTESESLEEIDRLGYFPAHGHCVPTSDSQKVL